MSFLALVNNNEFPNFAEYQARSFSLIHTCLKEIKPLTRLVQEYLELDYSEFQSIKNEYNNKYESIVSSSEKMVAKLYEYVNDGTKNLQFNCRADQRGILRVSGFGPDVSNNIQILYAMKLHPEFELSMRHLKMQTNDEPIADADLQQYVDQLARQNEEEENGWNAMPSDGPEFPIYPSKRMLSLTAADLDQIEKIEEIEKIKEAETMKCIADWF